MEKRFYDYELKNGNGEWEKIDTDKAFSILQESFGSVSQSVALMVMYERTIVTKHGEMKITENI